MQVTVDSKDLAAFVYQCVTGFYSAYTINLANRALQEKDLLHRTVLEWASVCTHSVLRTVKRDRKRFLRVTVYNIKANFGKAKKQ